MTRSLVLALALALPAAAADDPKAVIEKAVKAHGGAAALDKFPVHKTAIKGTITAQGMEIAVTGTMLKAYPDREKTTATLTVQGQELPLVVVSNGKEVSQTVGGMAVPLDDDRKADARFGTYASNLARLTPLLKGDGYTLKAGPEAAVDGKPAVGVVVEHKEHKPVTLYFDKASGLLVKLTRMGKNQEGQDAERESFFADYKAVSGVQLPHTLSTTSDGKKVSAFTVERYELLEKADDAEFKAGD
jgi:hypothetical protein